MKQKTLIALMCLMITGSSCNVFATEMMPEQLQSISSEAETEISPYFTTIITASGSAKLVDGKIQLYVTVSNRKSADVKITMQLQKKKRRNLEHNKNMEQVIFQ